MAILGYYPDDFIQLDLNHNSAKIKMLLNSFK